MNKIIAVDFDGTLAQRMYPKIGKPIQAVIDYCKEQQSQGAKLILWTMREGELLDDAINWCADRGLIFDAVNDNFPELQKEYNNNPRKVYADEYIDDHNKFIAEINPVNSVKSFCKIF